MWLLADQAFGTSMVPARADGPPGIDLAVVANGRSVELHDETPDRGLVIGLVEGAV